MEKTVTLEQFWSLESDPVEEIQDEKEWLKQMAEQAQAMADVYAKQNNL